MNKLTQTTTFDLEYFFEVAPDLLCIAGFDGYFKKINPAVSKTLGYTEKELFAAPINSFVHPDDQEITNKIRLSLTEGQSLMNFDNRYLAKDGSTVWLSWTSVPIARDRLVFAIAKNITYRKQIEEYDRISSILRMINDDHQQRFAKKQESVNTPTSALSTTANHQKKYDHEPSQSDQLWLNAFEAIVRKRAGKSELNLAIISDEMALSQRQLFRRIDRLLGVTPNKLVRMIRLQLAWEAIASGKYRTISEISNIAGYNSRSYFSRLFSEVYGIQVSELL